ncbi:3'-tRNA processing endoribonuclease [Aureococcus anophagefferens]|uniref:3'-tRNA processing endoribonuclease n=1 Tax=Aureococcus anophagefferens TaxID=44056 RepID=A0ABR1FV33_AURAN
MSRAETFPKPSILCHFLPTDAPLKATQPVDFGAALKPAVREGREGDVAELLAALTQARQMVTWALDKDRAPPPPPADADAAAPADAAAAPADAAAPPPAYDAAALAATPATRVSYAWRDLLDTKGRDWAMADCDLEEASVLLAAAQALLSRAARESINDANAVAVYASLARAGADGGERASQDLRLGLAEAWAALALAEAQHATIRRAAAAPHIEWSLVAALCADERQRYADAIAGRVASHVDYKGAYFEALARYCAGAGGPRKAASRHGRGQLRRAARRELAEAARAMAAASASAKDYVANAKAVCYLNNGIFHKPVPPPGPLPPAKSLVTAIPFDDPPPSPLWTDRAWALSPSSSSSPLAAALGAYSTRFEMALASPGRFSRQWRAAARALGSGALATARWRRRRAPGARPWASR